MLHKGHSEWGAQNHLLCLSFVYRLMDIAKEMTRECLPIKCLEAVILGMYPTNRSHTHSVWFSSPDPFGLELACFLCVCMGILPKSKNMQVK